MRFAYEVVKGMRACGLDKMNYEDFLIDYQLRHGNAHCPNPWEFGYPTIDRLFNAIRIVVLTRGHRQTKTISLTDEFRSKKIYLLFFNLFFFLHSAYSTKLFTSFKQQSVSKILRKNDLIVFCLFSFAK
jgi:hypothetical protein